MTRLDDAFTIEAWIYPTSPGSGAYDATIIVGKEGEYLLGRNSDGTIRYHIDNSAPDWT